MKILGDSTAFFKHQIDSLKHLLIADHSGLRMNEPSVQAAMIVASTTLITVGFGFYLKDYLIPGFIDKRTRNRNGQELFLLYKVNLFWAAYNFNNRLYEIFRTRSHYLWNRTAINSFYEYKYKSSVYRLCVLLGWIRAYKLSESNIVILNKDSETHKISECIFKLEAAFADGQRIEMYVAKSICSIIEVDPEKLEQTTLAKFSIEIDDIVNKYLNTHQKEYMSDIDTIYQDQFVEELQKLIDNLKISGKSMKGQKEKIIEEVSVKLALIYRDWQSAIGDLMLNKEEEKFFVISFKAFDEMWTKGKKFEHQWIKRAETIFSDLNINVNLPLDSRIDQLKLVYGHVYELLKTFFKIKVGLNPMSIENFNKIPSNVEVSNHPPVQVSTLERLPM